MGKNNDLGLPFGKMERIRIAFDVDGTLRCNCSSTCQDPNPDIVFIFNVLAGFKNTDMYVWSGGGAAYARRFAEMYGLKVKPTHCISKIDWRGRQIHLAFDDIQDTAIGQINLIVKEK